VRIGVVAIAALSVLGASAAASREARSGEVRGLVFDDRNGDGKPSTGEPGVAGAVVALGPRVLGTTDANGQFDVHVPDDTSSGIFWVRVPDGFRPGPAWAHWDAAKDSEVDLALHRLPQAIRAPFSFVVAADTHVSAAQTYFGGADLAAVARDATALDPAPAFFTVLGDITQGNQDAEFDLVDAALADLGVPWVPVPGNHDWYDAGETWFRRYGPDNYSFDVGGVHFVVWNMAMSNDDIRTYLGAELARVAPGMPIVALTHAPPTPATVEVLRELHVAYVLTGHTHTNRVVDHDGVIELSTEPLLMGGLDFTPAGYRVVTVTPGDARLATSHRTVVDAPFVQVMSPTSDRCAPVRSVLLVASALDAASTTVSARIDCATPLALAWVGGWTWRVVLPVLPAGAHTLSVEARSASGAQAATTTAFEICDAGRPPPRGDDWPQLGGGATHAGARDHELIPPLATRWTAAVGDHVVTAPPIIAGGTVYVATTDLADGERGGVVALDLATGTRSWAVHTAKPLRGGLAYARDGTSDRNATIVAAQIDGTVLAFDAATGHVVWQDELSSTLPAEAGALFGTPTADGGDVLVGHQRALAAFDAASGVPWWRIDPVPVGLNSQSLAAVAVGGGTVVGTFNRAFGGVSAWDRATGARLWKTEGTAIVGINASPVLDPRNDAVFAVTAADNVLALALSTGELRWHHKLDDAGFGWGNATIGTPALAHGVLVVPTLYRDLVALDATSGVELWRAAAAAPAIIRETHYRGAGETGFAASPIITGDIVWSVDTSGELAARSLTTGEALWRKPLGVPVLAGLAMSGDWLIVASYDGTVRALTPTSLGQRRTVEPAATCEAARAGGGCDTRGGTTTGLAVMLLVLVAACGRGRGARTRPRTP
jgi:outer membrane protein assembly factor BamB